MGSGTKHWGHQKSRKEQNSFQCMILNNWLKYVCDMAKKYYIVFHTIILYYINYHFCLVPFSNNTKESLVITLRWCVWFTEKLRKRKKGNQVKGKGKMNKLKSVQLHVNQQWKIKSDHQFAFKLRLAFTKNTFRRGPQPSTLCNQTICEVY